MYLLYTKANATFSVGDSGYAPPFPETDPPFRRTDPVQTILNLILPSRKPQTSQVSCPPPPVILRRGNLVRVRLLSTLRLAVPLPPPCSSSPERLKMTNCCLRARVTGRHGTMDSIASRNTVVMRENPSIVRGKIAHKQAERCGSIHTWRPAYIHA